MLRHLYFCLAFVDLSINLPYLSPNTFPKNRQKSLFEQIMVVLSRGFYTLTVTVVTPAHLSLCHTAPLILNAWLIWTRVITRNNILTGYYCHFLMNILDILNYIFFPRQGRDFLESNYDNVLQLKFYQNSKLQP